MDKLTAILSFLVTLSLATERITETIKGLPLISTWLASPGPPGTTIEELRKSAIQVLAMIVGTALTYLTRDQIAATFGMHFDTFWACLLFGVMASGGSGMWNSALDIVREVNQQKQLVTAQLKAAPPPLSPR